MNNEKGKVSNHRHEEIFCILSPDRDRCFCFRKSNFGRAIIDTGGDLNASFVSITFADCVATPRAIARSERNACTANNAGRHTKTGGIKLFDYGGNCFSKDNSGAGGISGRPIANRKDSRKIQISSAEIQPARNKTNEFSLAFANRNIDIGAQCGVDFFDIFRQKID